MENIANHKFTAKKVDTTMAEDYVKKIYESIEWPEKGDFLVMGKRNNAPTVLFNFELLNFISEIEMNDSEPNGHELAKKIIENTEMFVQLEYLARGTDPRDVREGHIKLMSQLLMCRSTLWNSEPVDFLHFTDTMPLYNLVYVVATYYHFQENCDKVPLCIVVGDKNMIPLCNYFVDLCHDVGLAALVAYGDPDAIEYLMRNVGTLVVSQEPENSIGCTGVVAERSDLDSAIDVFIDSSITAPWRLTQVYVQESVFEDFKDALAAKARVDGTCHSRLLVGDKTFLIECLESGQVGIPVHGYRTTKELLTLIKTPYLSLWAAESALSHEIALHSVSSTVWVNDYGSFEGPPRAALSVYNLFSERNSCFVSDKMMETLEPWKKLTCNERFEVIRAALKATTDLDSKQSHDISTKLDLLPRYEENFIDVGNKTICYGLVRSNILIGLGLQFCLINTLDFLIKGNAVAVWFGSTKFNMTFYSKLTDNGVPIQLKYNRFKYPRDTSDTKSIRFPMYLEKLKVIRTNYGTIFAN